MFLHLKAGWPNIFGGDDGFGAVKISGWAQRPSVLHWWPSRATFVQEQRRCRFNIVVD